MKHGSDGGELDDQPAESSARCLGWHSIQESSNPNTGGLFTAHYLCDWQGSPPLRGLHMKYSCLLVPGVCRWGWWFKQLIDVTVKAFHKVWVDKNGRLGSPSRLIIFLLSSHPFSLKQHYSRYGFIIIATYSGAKFTQPNRTLGHAFIWLSLCKQCSWRGCGGCKQALLKSNSVT